MEAGVHHHHRLIDHTARDRDPAEVEEVTMTAGTTDLLTLLPEETLGRRLGWVLHLWEVARRRLLEALGEGALDGVEAILHRTASHRRTALALWVEVPGPIMLLLLTADHPSTDLVLLDQEVAMELLAVPRPGQRPVTEPVHQELASLDSPVLPMGPMELLDRSVTAVVQQAVFRVAGRPVMEHLP